MAKYIDKENLPQYKYFNNFVNRNDELMDVVSDLITWQTMMERKGDRHSMIDAHMMFERARKRMPEFVYKDEDDRKTCMDDFKARRNINNYISLLLILPFIQGRVSEDKVFISDTIAKKSGKRYQYDEKNGRYYYEIPQVPKLLLINNELYDNYKDFKDIDNEIIEKIIENMDKTVNYIINIQHEEVAEYSYYVSLKSEKGIEIHRIGKFSFADYCSKSIKKKTMTNDMKTMLYCLLDYLIEYKKLESKKKKYVHNENSSNIKETVSSKFISKSSVKVFDLKKDDEQLEAYRYTKRNVAGWLKGYAKSPHTRRGHIRKLKNGKEVYVRASVIHKDRFDSIESAHRINQ